MDRRIRPGLGELLRYVGDMVDQGADARYRALGLNYRARYTPILRALAIGAETVTQITAASYLTQGAVSQTITLMARDEIIGRHGLDDARKSGVHLTDKGHALVEKLEPQWTRTFAAIATLEREIGHPLRRALEDMARALERQSFQDRLAEEGDDEEQSQERPNDD